LEKGEPCSLSPKEKGGKRGEGGQAIILRITIK
jgi:hypothetical protein